MPQLEGDIRLTSVVVVLLECRDIDKTHTYIERSKAAPLETCRGDYPGGSYTKEVFLLVVPHIGRLKCLTFPAGNLLYLRPRQWIFGRRPLVTTRAQPGRSNHLLSLEESVKPHRRPAFDLRQIPADRITATQLLSFFENAPLLHMISLEGLIPGSSDVPEWVVIILSRGEFF